MEVQDEKLDQLSFSYIMSITLKSIAQGIFVENSVSGLMILLGLTIIDYRLGLVAFISGLVGSLLGYFGGGDRELVDQGLFGFNSVLAGLSLSIFLSGQGRWIIILLAVSLVPIVTAAMVHLQKKIGIPALTFPFITTTWTVLLAAYYLKSINLGAGIGPGDLSSLSLHIKTSPNFIEGIINGVGQVYYQEELWFGVLVLLAVFWDSRKLGVYTLLGVLSSWIGAYLLGADYNTLDLGLYGYNAILAILTISGVHSFSPVIGILAAMATVPLVASLSSLLLAYGLPVLTMPFVLVAWIFIGARKVLPKL